MWYIDTPECLLCLLESRYSELRNLRVNDPIIYARLGEYIMRNADRGRVTVFVESHNWIRRELNNNDLHASEKSVLERYVKEAIGSLIMALGDDVIKYVELAAAANSVDIPMRGYRFDMGNFINRLSDEVAWLGITRDELRSTIESARSIGYVVDNAGEFQVDKALLIKLRELGKEVVVYARSEPYEVDVTASYVINETRDLGIKVVGSGSAYTALFNKELWDGMRRHDVLFLKGLDNFETYLELDPPLSNAIMVLRVKCPLIARILNIPINTPIIATPAYVMSKFRVAVS